MPMSATLGTVIVHRIRRYSITLFERPDGRWSGQEPVTRKKLSEPRTDTGYRCKFARHGGSRQPTRRHAKHPDRLWMYATA